MLQKHIIIQSLCRLIKSIQQGQRTALVSLAKIVQDQRDEIEKYQTLLKLPKEVRQLQLRMDKLKKHVDTHLERTDKKTSVTSVTISEIRSQIHRLETTMEGNFEHIPEPDKPSWVFPGNIVELHTPEDDILFHEECVSQIPIQWTPTTRGKLNHRWRATGRAGQYTPWVEST